MSLPSTTEIIAVLTGTLGALGGILAVISSARKEELGSLRDTMDTLTHENARLVQRQKEIETSLDQACKRADALDQKVRSLTKQMDDMQVRIKYLQCENEDYRNMLLQHGLSNEDIINGGVNAPRTGKCDCTED